MLLFSVILQPLSAMFTITIPVSIFLTQFNAKTKIFNILYITYYFMIFTFIYRVIFVQEIYILLKILQISLSIFILRYNLLYYNSKKYYITKFLL